MTAFQLLMVVVLVLTGMTVALLGSIKIPLASRLRIDEARVGGLASLFGLALIPVFPATGILTDLLGKPEVLIGGSVLLAAGLGVLAAARHYPAALAAVLLLSTGWTALINVGNVLVYDAWQGDDKAYVSNLANVFFGLGAFLTPMGMAFLVRRLSLPLALALLALLALVPGALALVIALPEEVSPPADLMQEFLTLLGNPFLWLCGAALFFYGPLEASMGMWTTTYLQGRGVGEGTAANVLSGFWLMFMAARLVTAFTLPAGYGPVLVLSLSLACIAVLLGVVLTRGRTAAVALVLAAGLVFGPIFPTTIAILMDQVSPPLRGRAVGLFFAIGGVGWSVIPILIGAYARRAGVQRGFWVAVAAAAALSGVALTLLRYTAAG